MANRYTIQQAAEATGVSAHTLRYYERIGLLKIARAANGHRRYTDDDLGWVRFIMLLRSTDMPLDDIATFVKLEKEGEDTITKRRIMLEQHRVKLNKHIADLQTCLVALSTKIGYYSEVDDAMLACVQYNAAMDELENDDA
ncbi:MAG: MerR family transcriptional regulator [Chloroflexota bacterium]